MGIKARATLCGRPKLTGAKTTLAAQHGFYTTAEGMNRILFILCVLNAVSLAQGTLKRPVSWRRIVHVYLSMKIRSTVINNSVIIP